jgi:hypothetical protein
MAMAVGMNLAGAVIPAVAAQAAVDDPATKLKQLKALLDQQLITLAEYDAKKKEILAKI